MLESLKWLGEQLARDMTDEEKLREFVKLPNVIRDDQYLIKIIFDLDKKKIFYDYVQLTMERLKEYLWIGHTYRAAKEPVTRLTVDDLKYIFEMKNNVIINIYKETTKRSYLLNNIYVREFKNLIFELLNFIKDHREDLEKLKKELAGLGKDHYYTICVKRNGQLQELAKSKGYKKVLMDILLVPKPEELIDGVCHVCGKRTKVLVDPSFESGSILKVYVTNQKGFSSGISGTDESWLKNFAICVECRKHLLLAWSYVRNGLVVQDIRGINVYLIPKLLRPISIEKWDGLRDFLKDSYGAVSSYDILSRFERELHRYTEFIEKASWYELTIIFGTRGRADFNLEIIIQDVPVTRFEYLRRLMGKYENAAKKVIGGDSTLWSLRFRDIYNIFPIPYRKGRPLNLRSFLELLDTILSGHSYDMRELMERAILFARIHRFRTYNNYNIRKARNPDLEMSIGILKYNLLNVMLGELAMLGKKERMDFLGEPQKHLPDEIKEWFRLIGYDDLQQALFLLGYLIGEIGTAQYAKGDSRKAILNKIDFNGMGKDEVVALTLSIYESLRNYNLLTKKNEIIYYVLKTLLDKNLHRLSEDPIANVYYIFSGYAFITARNILKGGG